MSQFMVVPPLAKVAALFLKLTGKELHVETTWSSWLTYTAEDFEWLRPYIRHCHQKIFIETISGEQPNPLALLRQLLRPHGMRVEQKHNTWSITVGSPMPKAIREKEGILLDWSL
jgi:hypothetical protein